MLGVNERNAAATIGTSVSVVSPQIMTGRYRIRIYRNISTGGQIISLAKNANAVAGSGIVLNAGDAYQESMEGGFIPTNVLITAVSNAASGMLAIYEETESAGL